MIDIKLLREAPERYRTAAAEKGIAVDINRLLEIDQLLRELQQELDALRQQRNDLAKGKNTNPEKGKMLKEMAKAKEAEMRLMEGEHRELLLQVPNFPSPESPVGKDASANVQIERWGKPKEFGFPIKDHIALGKELDIVDFERGVKIHGFRGYILKNEAVLLQQAVLQLALQKMRKAGFIPIIPPVLVKEFALYGSGHFPFGREEVFEIKNTEDKEAKDRLYLAGTSEPSLLALHADEMLEETALPLRYCAVTPCYRSEVGSYGKDTKGLYRIHEFMKVEQVIICRNDLAEAEGFFNEMEGIAREMLQDLELPYRVMNVSTGDMGAGKYKMHDIETWMPSRKGYGETHSNSLLTDWQARRLNIKYRNTLGEKQYPYTLNNTVIASPRILIAILENHQQADGSVAIPKILQPLCGFDRITH